MIRIIYILLVGLLFSDDKATDYFGGWPFNPNKDQIDGANLIPDCEGEKKEVLCECAVEADCLSSRCFPSPRVGRYCLQGAETVFPEVILQDQFGEEVNLYDFAGQGKLIVMELSASWCRPCRQLADWISNGVPDVTSNRNWKKEYNIIKDLIYQDRIYFINVLLQDEYKDVASLETLEDWFQMYSDDKIPVLADSDGLIRDWTRPTGYPTIIVLNDKMETVQFSIRGWHEAFNYISKLDWSKEANKKKD